MAVVSGIRPLWYLNPRLIVSDETIDEVVVQDLHDSCRDSEDEPDAMIYPKIISSAGKEELGGGVTVGITSTLQNARKAFAAHKEWASAGTITTADATGVTLIDSAATFDIDLVQPGSWVVNLTDGSIATAFVVSGQQLVTDTLGGGADNKFEVGDEYRVLIVKQKRLTGGNMVAVDAFGAEIDPVLPTAGTQVVRTASSSATLQELADIQYSSFGGAVTIDLVNGVPGTAYAIGTPRIPSGSLSDALSIANTRGFKKLRIIGDATIDSGLDYRGFTIEGESQTKTTLTVSSLAQVDNAEFEFATVTGTLDGGAKLTDCRIGTLNYVDGFIERCVLNGVITLSGIDTAHFLDCWSGIPGVATPTIDMGGSGSDLAVRNYNGGLTITNKSGTDAVSIDMNSGQVIIDSSVTAGVVVVRGLDTPDQLTDNSVGADVRASFVEGGTDIDLAPTYDTAAQLLRVDVSLNRLGVPVTTGLVSATLVMRDDTGALVTTIVGVFPTDVDAQGVFHLSEARPELATALHRTFQMFATVVDGSGSVVRRHALPLVG